MPKKGSPTDLLFEEANQARYGDNRRKQPLIIPKYLSKAAELFNPLSDDHIEHHRTIIKWADLESTGQLQKMNESNLQGEFIAEVFGGVLGYVRYSQRPEAYELHEHFSLPGGQDADAAIGLFGKENGNSPTAVIELKGPKVNVDRDRFNGRTPVRQCWDYLNELPDCPWGIVCNYVSFRLYHRNQTPNSYELFTLQELRDVKRFREFLTLLERGGLLPTALHQIPRALRLLAESQNRQREVGKELYKLYHEKRLEFVGHLRKSPFDKTLDQAIAIAQTLLDRIVFIAFCQCRELLPANSIDHTWSNIRPFDMATNPRWHNFLNLFQSIDKGNDRFNIPRFNGGLFAPNPEVDNLDLDDRWTDFFKTIGTYDFKDEVNVDVLGHLFEQSITDIETIKADPAVLAEPAKKVSGKRKREGVYYTPPRITTYIVEHTVKPCIDERFAAIARKYDLDLAAEPEKGRMREWAACHEEMLASLASLRICDPACGSGAFLVQAFDYLEGVYADLIAAICHEDKQAERKMLEEAKRRILTDNLFGVDLSLEAVEIARLALWIRSARRGQTLADLSQNIQCGNSIVDDRAVDPKAMDWQSRFKPVFAEGGFDCVISNPPYVKLQNFRKTSPATAAYLVTRYRSAKTGNFDLFLPFIEHGLELLKPAGRLGFIAPSLWTFNEYGQGLRELVLEKRALERFVDFKSFQVFEDATTYTALQFFANKAVESIQVVDAGEGDTEANLPFSVSFSELGSGAWALLPHASQRLIDVMRQHSVPLKEASNSIFTGLQTSADDIYHLVKLGEGRYYSRTLQRAVELEDELLRPLVSGEDAVPFAMPSTDKFVLFPYHVTSSEYRLLTPKEMAGFKRIWQYLKANETALRGRENGKMDHDKWYGYVYLKSLDKQDKPKLLVPRLLLNLFAASDPHGRISPDNVDVGGLIPAAGWSLYYLLGILNSHACNYVWRHTAKPFRGGYRSANKQFIAPLPIPNVKPPKQKPVADAAKKLAELHGKRLAALAKVQRRIAVDLAPAVLVNASPLPPNLPGKLAAFDRLAIGDALKEAAKFAKRPLKPAEREQWDAYLTAQTNAIAKVNRQIDDLTAELNQMVYALYGLEKDDIQVIEATSPPKSAQ